MNRFCILLAFVAAACSQAPAETGEIPALKDVYKDAFKIGAAVSSFDVSGRSPETVDLILKHFNSLTPGNELKPESLHPRPDV
ncbi:MAG: endo-1,4-beta-xylanase, partial [Bacteroidales bacterium]|nr:endo-1,4-beta-xylanase [Bacteroidales bacterium]